MGMFDFMKKKPDTAAASEALIGSLYEMMEDVGWKRPTTEFEDIPEADRIKVVERSRSYLVKHPMYRRIMSLNKAFVLGKGIRRPSHRNPAIQFAIDKLWTAVSNQQTFTGFHAFEVMLEQRDGTGEIFFKIYTDTVTGMSTVRVETNPYALKNVITDSEDAAKTIAYEYEQTIREYNKEKKSYDERKETVYIPDIYAANTAGYPPVKSGNTVITGYLAVFGATCLKDQRRGMPLYYQILPWLKAHREVCEDGATFLKALTRFAWKKKYKNISKDAMTGIAALAKTFTDAGAVNNPTPSTAATILESDNVTNESIEVKQNPAIFTAMADLLLQSIASGSDKMKHYFANPENANLATATSMELPMIKDFEAQQTGLKAIINTVLGYCVVEYLKKTTGRVAMQMAQDAGYVIVPEKQEKWIEEVDKIKYDTLGIAPFTPKLISKAFAQQISGLVAAYNAGGLTDKDLTYQVYDLLEYDNVEDIVANIFGDDYQGQMSAGQDAAGAAAGLEEEIPEDEDEPKAQPQKGILNTEDEDK